MQDTLSFPFLFVLPYLCPQFLTSINKLTTKRNVYENEKTTIDDYPVGSHASSSDGANAKVVESPLV